MSAVHATILKSPTFVEEGHATLMEVMENYEKLFFENQNEPLQHMVVFVFNPLPPQFSKPKPPVPGYHMVVILPPMNTAEEKSAFGMFWKRVTTMDEFVCGFQMFEGFYTELPEGTTDIPFAYNMLRENPSNRVVRRESLMFVAADSQGWKYMKAVPFIRPEEGSLPVKVFEPVEKEDLQVGGRCTGE